MSSTLIQTIKQQKETNTRNWCRDSCSVHHVHAWKHWQTQQTASCKCHTDLLVANLTLNKQEQKRKCIETHHTNSTSWLCWYRKIWSWSHVNWSKNYIACQSVTLPTKPRSITDNPWRPLLPYGLIIIKHPQGWASECPDVKNYKWLLNLVWYRMLNSCTHMVTVGVKGYTTPQY